MRAGVVDDAAALLAAYHAGIEAAVTAGRKYANQGNSLAAGRSAVSLSWGWARTSVPELRLLPGADQPNSGGE